MVKSCRLPHELNEETHKVVKTKGADLRVHFKNTYETAAAIRGKPFLAAKDYLHEVMKFTKCVPFRKFTGGIGRTAQARNIENHTTSQGRWPVKSCKTILNLFVNLEANAASSKIPLENLYIWHIAVQQAAKGRRRTYRAHGRINPYMSHPCHIEIICKTIDSNVPLPAAEAEQKVIKLKPAYQRTKRSYY